MSYEATIDQQLTAGQQRKIFISDNRSFAYIGKKGIITEKPITTIKEARHKENKFQVEE